MCEKKCFPYMEVIELIFNFCIKEDKSLKNPPKKIKYVYYFLMGYCIFMMTDTSNLSDRTHKGKCRDGSPSFQTRPTCILFHQRYQTRTKER